MALLGLAQGATYTPAIMLVSTNAPPDRKASAVGWVLAGMSAGYVLSIVLANAMLATADYGRAPSGGVRAPIMA
jgi:MFS family permease